MGSWYEKRGVPYRDGLTGKVAPHWPGGRALILAKMEIFLFLSAFLFTDSFGRYIIILFGVFLTMACTTAYPKRRTSL